MGLLNLLSLSKFGFGGKKPNFNITPNPPGSLHDTYSIDGNPKITLTSTNPLNPVPRPSILDEKDVNNTNKFRSREGQRYIDNLPK
jgi:hypothetical protein